MNKEDHSFFAVDQVTEELPWATAPDVAFKRWIVHARTTRGDEPYTVLSCQQYTSMWGQFCEFMREKQRSVLDLSPTLLEQFVAQRKGIDNTPWAAVTVRRYLALLDRVYSKFQNEKLCKHNPAKELLAQHHKALAPAAIAHLPQSLDEQFVATVQAFREDSWKRCRDKTMLLLLPGSGLTQNEVLNLLESDLRLTEAAPHVIVPAHGKRDARAVSLSPFAVTALRRWLECKAQYGLKALELFPSKPIGGTLNASTLYRHVEAVLDGLGVSQQKGARRLRHTFAIRQLSAGAPENAVKDWLGLSSDEMLVRYRKLVPARYGVTAV